jgi:type VI protein secretion system component Hcp
VATSFNGHVPEDRSIAMAADIFAKIGDIKGESLDSRHRDEIEVLSWSWGVSQSGSIAHGGGGRGKRVSTISAPLITSTRRRRR